MATLYNIMLYGGLALAVIFAVTAVILFFVLKIPKAIGDVTGSTARKKIEEIREKGYENVQSGGASKQEAIKAHSTKISVRDVQSASSNRQAEKGRANYEKAVADINKKRNQDYLREIHEDATDILHEDMQELHAGGYADEEATDVLREADEEATDVLRYDEADEEATDVLRMDEADEEATDVLRMDDADEEATDVLRMDDADEEATDVLRTEEADEEATDVLRSDEADEEATDVLRSDEVDEEATDVLRSEDVDEEATDVLRMPEAESYGTAGTGDGSAGAFRMIKDIVVVHSDERI